MTTVAPLRMLASRIVASATSTSASRGARIALPSSPGLRTFAGEAGNQEGSKDRPEENHGNKTSSSSSSSTADSKDVPPGENAAFGYFKRFSVLVQEELKDMFDMTETDVSTTRRRPERKEEEYTGTTDVAVTKAPPKTGWSKRWDEVKDQAKTTAFFQKVLGLKEHKIVKRANEVADDLRDRWETSDSAFVHKIQDNLQETEFAAATREIRVRDPTFDMVEFLRNIRQDIRPVMNAYLKGDMDVLKEHCSSEVCERVQAQQRCVAPPPLPPLPPLSPWSDEIR